MLFTLSETPFLNGELLCLFKDCDTSLFLCIIDTNIFKASVLNIMIDDESDTISAEETNLGTTIFYNAAATHSVCVRSRSIQRHGGACEPNQTSSNDKIDRSIQPIGVLPYRFLGDSSDY